MIKFILSNIVTDEKNDLLLISSNFVGKFFNGIFSQYEFITFGVFNIKNNARDECKQIYQSFNIFQKNKYDKSYKFIEFHSLLVVKSTLLNLTNENININKFKYSSIVDVNYIKNICFTKNKENFYLFLYLLPEIIFSDFPLFIWYEKINFLLNNFI